MKDLNLFVAQNESAIENWVSSRLFGKEPFFYNSSDIRYSGFKVTQVDTNCFPAGFNNLSLEGYQKSVTLYREYFSKRNIKSILVFPEFHTRNFGYLKNIRTLKALFEEAGTSVKIATNLEYKFNIDLNQSDIRSVSDELGLTENSLNFDPIKKYKWFFQKKYKIGTSECKDGSLKSCCFFADAVILNNDLTMGMPDILKDIKADIIPLPKMGWFNRTKSNHFRNYSEVVNEFAADFKIDPWLFDAYFEEVNEVDFSQAKGTVELQLKLEEVFKKVQTKYDEYGIKKHPTVFIKANKGTYGMGIHVITNPDEVASFNKNIRKKMSVIKDGIQNRSVIIQEGVPTIFEDSGNFLEPVVYSALSKPVGTFFRKGKGDLANLNARGVEFVTDFNLTHTENVLINLVASFANLAVLKECGSL